jgi:hypothetical protein
VRISRQIEAGRAPLGAGQRDQLDRIEADGTEPDRLGYRERHDVFWHGLQPPQHLDKLTLAAIAHARLEPMAQMLEHFRQVPALQCGGLRHG